MYINDPAEPQSCSDGEDPRGLSNWCSRAVAVLYERLGRAHQACTVRLGHYLPKHGDDTEPIKDWPLYWTARTFPAVTNIVEKEVPGSLQ